VFRRIQIKMGQFKLSLMVIRCKGWGKDSLYFGPGGISVTPLLPVAQALTLNHRKHRGHREKRGHRLESLR
jgi:hypothetical protein